MIPRLLPVALALALTLGGCWGGAPSEDAAVAVSVIGGEVRSGDPSAGPLDMPQRVLMGATAQGLVRFDAAGQIEPGLAERWTVTGDGRSYIFRLREAAWPDGTPVTAEQVVRVLRRAAAPGSRNPLAPFLFVIDEIVEMTPQVIEVRLSRPRPDLLKVFAQPELAIFRAGMGGSGPFVAEPTRKTGVLLRPATDPAVAGGEDAPAPKPGGQVLLRGGGAALALSRYQLGRVALVLGGTFTDWPIVGVAGVAREAIRIDPALGMFGLAVVEREGFLADAGNRAAVAMAIDRAALTRAIHPDWQPVETILPAQLDSAAAPAAPAWGPLPLDARRENARVQVRAWQRAHPGPVVVRIAMPSGPGARLVWGYLAVALQSVGITAQRTGLNESADLRLIDAVAPYDSGRWFLVTACRLCSDDVAASIAAARDAPDLAGRAQGIAAADALLTRDSAYIPIAQPLRWSIVSSQLKGWQGNTRAWHPLNHLRNESE
jgi:peptide/nickel transport system substrate-binding protein